MPSSRELVQSLYNAFALGDAGTVLGAMHENVDWKEAESSPYADQNPYTGPQRVGEGVFGRLMADYDGFTVTPHKLVAEGDTVVALGRYTASHRASGQPLDAQFAHEWVFRDGRVVGFQQYTDTAQYQQLAGSGT
jgi:ketosteroid isomerase-like protein